MMLLIKIDMAFSILWHK